MSHVVLLVDDDPAITDGLSRALRKEPYTLMTASNAQQAIRLLSTSQIDVIVTDEKMPGMSGKELLAFVCEHYPNTMRIMLSGNSTFDVAIDTINRGEIYRFYIKPCNEIDLALGIRDAIKQRELVVQTKRLLKIANEQQRYIRSLGRRDDFTPRDSEGTISIPEPTEDLQETLKEVEQKLGLL
jgi:two-component system probable response regulator PhcQ